MSESKELEILIRTKMGEDGAKQAAASVQRLKDEVSGANTGLKGMGDSTARLSSVAKGVGILSAAIGGPLIMATKTYVSTMGMAESTSRGWLKANYEVEQSYLRIGRVGAKAVLPWMEKAADLAEKVAKYAEGNPEQVKAGIGLGAAGIGVAGIMKGVGYLKGAGIGGKLAGGLTGLFGAEAVAGGIMTLMPPIALLATALTGLALLLNTKFGQQGVTAGKQVLSMAAGGIASLFGGQEAGNKAFLGTSKALGLIAADQDKKEPDNFMTDERVLALRGFQRQLEYQEIDYKRSLFVANRDFNRQRLYEETDYNKQRSRGMRDFNLNLVQTERMFYYQRSIANRDFQINLSRNEFDYTLTRKRAQEDHNFSLKQIMLSGDALSYYYSQRQFNIDKQRAEEDYQRQKQRSQEDFNRSQNDQLNMFNIERAFQLKMFEISRADQEYDYSITRKRALYQYQVQLKDQDYQYKLQVQRSWTAFVDQFLPELMKEASIKAKIQSDLNAAMVNNFNALYSKLAGSAGQRSIASGTSLPSGIPANAGVARSVSNGIMADAARWVITNLGGADFWNGITGHKYANGGYTGSGGIVHANEYVLTAATTKAAEGVARGSLTQEKILGMLSGNSMVYQDQRQFSRGLDADEKIQMRNELRQMVADAFNR